MRTGTGAARAQIDCTVVLTLHNEGRFLHRTLRSLDEAAAYAGQRGHTSEIVMVLDRVDPETERIATGYDWRGFAMRDLVSVSNGSLGKSRNDGIAAAKGDYICMADGDDLVSFNILGAMIELARSEESESTIYFPELLIAFGERSHTTQYFDLERVSPLSLFGGHTFISRIFAHRRVFDALSYRDVPLTAGYAFEDWHFNAEAVALGMNLKVARDTMLFYRQRMDSLLARANLQSARQIPPSRLFHPGVYRMLMRRDYDAYRPLTTGLRAPAVVRPDLPTCGGAFVDTAGAAELLAAANAIDPAIQPSVIRTSPFHSSLEWSDLRGAIAYFEICGAIGSSPFHDVFLMPGMSDDDEDSYFIEIVNALVEFDPVRRILVIMGEPTTQSGWADRLPLSCQILYLADEWPGLTAEDMDLVTLRILQVNETANVHLRQGVSAQRFFRRYHTILQGHRCYVYRLTASRTPDPAQAESCAFQFISEYLPYIHKVICDTAARVRADRDAFRVSPGKWACLHAPLQATARRGGDDRSSAAGAAPDILCAPPIEAQRDPARFRNAVRDLFCIDAPRQRM